jgi:hypothetical protein
LANQIRVEIISNQKRCMFIGGSVLEILNVAFIQWMQGKTYVERKAGINQFK